MNLRPFASGDATVLAAVSQRAFENDVLHGAPEKGGPPGYDSPAWQTETARTATAYLVIEVGGRVVGGVIVFGSGGDYWIGRMFIDPDHQGRGYGLAALASLEREYPEATRWSLETPPWNKRNHRFYEKAGYTRAGTSKSGDYLFEKRTVRSNSGVSENT
jgi:RimJ/RimL family protein N-acetyltransferase